MKLLLKFNIIFALVFVLGLAGSSWLARGLLAKAAAAEVAESARLLMENATAVSTYTADQIKPLLAGQMADTFLPQSVPAYSAAEVQVTLQKHYPEYRFKSAMLNPTNPRDRAVDWEEDVIAQFSRNAELKELVGKRDTPTGPSLYVARPIRISNPVCLSCHSTPAAAPATLVERYGPSNGFGWKLGDTLGAQLVSVPMAVPLARAHEALKVVVGALAAVFLLIGAALNFMLWKLVIQPVKQLAELADRVSLGELTAPEFELRSRDEVGMLAQSFGRMRKSLTHAMKMLDV